MPFLHRILCPQANAAVDKATAEGHDASKRVVALEERIHAARQLESRASEEAKASRQQVQELYAQLVAVRSVADERLSGHVQEVNRLQVRGL